MPDSVVVVSQTGPQGPKGSKGDPGAGIGVLGVFETVEALRAAHPSGSVGDVYAVGFEGVSVSLYCWDPSSMDWSDIGQFVGPPGPVGPQGRQGDPGASGAKGDAGDPGVQGDPGPAGEQGATGSDGKDGAQGPSGPDGPTGPVGPDGQKGDKGDRGEPLNIKGYYSTEADLIAAHPTGQDGDAYLVGEGFLYVWQTVGNGWVNVGQLQGPKGDAGPQGERGAQGSTGAQGQTGPQGDKGINGDIGPQGVQGPAGAQGPKGDQGPQGTDGDSGKQSIRYVNYDYWIDEHDDYSFLYNYLGRTLYLTADIPKHARITVLSKGGRFEVFQGTALGGTVFTKGWSRAEVFVPEQGVYIITGDVLNDGTPDACFITSAIAGDETATITWQYLAAEAILVDCWDVSVSQSGSPVATVRVSDPKAREYAIGGLANGVEYEIRMEAVNEKGSGPWSNTVTVTPVAVDIPAPVISSVTPGNTYVRVVFADPAMPGIVRGHKYRATRTDSGAITVGDLIGSAPIADSAGVLANDVEYVVSIAAVCEINGDLRIGKYSDPSKPFIPANPVVPYAPIWAHVDADKWDRTSSGGGKGVDWKLSIGSGVRGDAVGGPLDIWGYRYEIKEKSSGRVVASGDKPSSQPVVNITVSGEWMDGIAVMTCWARNKLGESKATVLEFDAEPHAELLIDFGVWYDVGEYRYHVAQEDVLAYAKVNPAGVGKTFEYVLVGGGGAGYGRTDVGGIGGHGGSGETRFGTFVPSSTGGMTAKIGNGALYGNPTGGTATVLTVNGDPVSAAGGGSATGKPNGTPDLTEPYIDMSKKWAGCDALPCFSWALPRSGSVGGFCEWANKDRPPDGDLFGQAGGGTNSAGVARGGQGGPGLAIVRYRR